MQLAPYLNFDGTCAEAFRFYAEILDGKLDLMTFGQSPMAGEVPPDWHDRVMHVYMVADGAALMGSDTPPGQFDSGHSVHVTVNVDDPAEAERIYNAFSDGASITMEMQTTFWAQRFGMLIDRYGISWIINGGMSEQPNDER